MNVVSIFIAETQAFIAEQKVWMAKRKKMLDEMR
jgi:hypothetical protein